MIETERKKLGQHQKITETTIHGWPSFFFGLPFLGAGIAIVLVSLDVIPASDAQFNVPREVVAIFGGVFAWAGLLLIFHGMAGLRRRARWEEMRRARPGEPWLADYPWNPAGSRERGAGQWLKNLMGMVFIIVFLVPFHYIAFFMEGGGGGVIVFKIVVVFFDLLILIGLGYGVYVLARRLKYGTAYLRLHTFPYFLGDRLDATLQVARALPRSTEVKVVLRCVEERYETRQVGRNRRTEVVADQLYAETKTEPAHSADSQGRMQLPISFSLPEDSSYSTALSERPATYWELVISAETPGIDYGASFLVPVYARD